MMHTAKYMHQILSLSNDAYDEIFQEIDTTGLVEKKGIIYIWTNKNLKSRKILEKVLDDFSPDLVYVHNTWFKASLVIFDVLKKRATFILLILTLIDIGLNYKYEKDTSYSQQIQKSWRRRYCSRE